MNEITDEEIIHALQFHKKQLQKYRDNYYERKKNPKFVEESRVRSKDYYDNNKKKILEKKSMNKELNNSKAIYYYYKNRNQLEKFKLKHPQKYELVKYLIK